MHWQDKLNQLIIVKSDPNNKHRLDVDIVPYSVEWLPGELEEIIKDYPWLPHSYNSYLKKYDNTSIVFCRFLGSEKNSNFFLKYVINETSEQGLGKDHFPFASDADGSLFVFDKSGKVYWWDIEDYEFAEKPKLLANSFDEFMDECLMGYRYQEFIDIENDDMWQYYKEQGWA